MEIKKILKFAIKAFFVFIITVIPGENSSLIAGDKDVTSVPILGLRYSRDLKKSASPIESPTIPLAISNIICLSEIVSHILKIKIVGIRSNKDISSLRKFTLREPILLIAFEKK